MSDARASTYRELHSDQLSSEESQNRYSAGVLLDILSEYLPRPASVLDVGCGIGTWLSVLQDSGVSDLCGVDGPWLDVSRTVFDSSRIKSVDLEAAISLGRSFDLVLCIEVAEHVSPQAAARFIDSLVRHSKVVMFSAAIPHQGGHGHVNEQYLPYWVEQFARHDYRPVDIFRPRVWNDRGVLFWLRQNLVLFTHKDTIAASGGLKRAAELMGSCLLSVVHPELFDVRVQVIDNLRVIESMVMKPGTFRTRRTADGRLFFERIGD